MRQTITFLLLLASLATAYNFPVYEKQLENGLRILVAPNTDVAVVSCRLYYFMGSYYEVPGATGLSHMYEHMLFKGTKRLGTTNYEAEIPLMHAIDSIDAEIVALKKEGYTEEDSLIIEKQKAIFTLLDEQRKYIKKDELWGMYQRAGGTGLNAWTSDDITAYTVTLPANKVELFANIEADRMEHPVLREFYSERDVVTEERRMRYENKPTNQYWLNLESLFYTASPYGLPTIGWYSDIRNYTREKMEEHVKKYYRPDNALIVFTGNIDTTEAFPLIEKYFGHIKTPENPLPSVVTREPKPMGEKRYTVYAKATPRIDILYHTPGYPHKDLYSLDLLENILSGRSGRLSKRLVDKEKLCTSIGAGNRWRLADGSFHVWCQLAPGADAKVVEDIILEEIEILANSEPSENELEKTRNSMEVYFAEQLQKLESLSDNLAFFEKLGDWKEIFRYQKEIGAIKETSSIVKKYLNPRYRTVGYLLSETEEK